MPINKVTITPPATGSTLTIADGKTITCTQDTSLDEAVAMSSKAPKDNPTLTGIPTAPTPAANDNTTKIATTEFIQAKFGVYDIHEITESGE